MTQREATTTAAITNNRLEEKIKSRGSLRILKNSKVPLTGVALHVGKGK